MMDIRASLGTALVKFLKIGRLTFGSGADSLRESFDGKSLKEGNFWQAYQENVWAYRAINAIACAGGQLPIRVVQATAAGNQEIVKNHPFSTLIENPNPFMTRQDLIELLLIFLESTGDGYWLFDDGTGKGRPSDSPLKIAQVKEIWPIPSHQIKPNPDATDFIKGYEFKPDRSGKSDTLSNAEVFHVRYPSPATLLQGQGAIMPITSDLAADRFAANFERFIMRNLATNIVFLKTTSTFSSDQREEYRRALAAVFRGVRIAFMENGLDFATPQIAAKDLPFLELDTRRQKRILASFGVPPLLAGSEDAKYDNAEQQKAVFWENTMLPKCSRVGSMLTKKLYALDDRAKTMGLSVILDTSGVKALQADFGKQSETALRWRGMGVPVNNLIKVFGPSGLEEVEGGDVPLVDGSLIPLDELIDPSVPLDPEGTPEDAPPPTDEGDDKEPRAGDPESQARGPVADKAIDNAHWKRFIATSEPGFRRLRAAMSGYFKRQKGAVLSNLAELYGKGFGALTKDARVDLVMLDWNDEAKVLSKKTSPILKAIYQKMGKQAIEDIGASIAFNINSPAAVEFLTDHVMAFSRKVNDTTRARLTKLLQEKFATGATQQEITKAIQQEYQFAERYRAARVARTESGIAGNAGIFDGMKQAGVESKRWISSRDEKVRETHKIADGQEVGINEPFDVGGELLDHPGDPDGSPENTINCRCVVRAPRQRS